MKVRELIRVLANQPDMDGKVYMRLKKDNGDIQFIAVDGIATEQYSYFYMSGKLRITCTTLLAE